MYGKSAPFHAPEPGHLTLGKLVNGDFQERRHFVEGVFAQNVFSQIFIFEAIVNQVFRGNPLVEKAPYFIDHAGIETCPEAGGNAFAAQFPVDVYTDNIAVERRVLTAFGWKSFVVFGNFDGSNGPFCRVYAGLVMQYLVSLEYGFKF